MRQALTVGALLFLLVLGGAALVRWRTLRVSSGSSSPGAAAVITAERSPRVPLHVGEATVMVEIARTAEEQARGLSGRDSLPADAGMLFVFPDAAPRTFWMKDTRMPLDLIWIRGGSVVSITANVQPEPGVPDDRLRRYPSPGPVDEVLEVSAGWAAARGVRPGVTVRIEEWSPTGKPVVPR